MNWFTELHNFLSASTDERVQQAGHWTEAAVRALTNLLWRAFGWSLFILVLPLGLSAGFQTTALVAWFAFPYILFLAGMLYTRQAAASAGLLIAFDAAIDLFNGVLPPEQEKLGKLAKLNPDLPRLRELATLQLVARFVFSMALFELLVLLLFSFIPIWTHPRLIGPLLLSTLVFGLLKTPWGQVSPFGKLANLVGVICVGLIVAFGWQEAQQTIQESEFFMSYPLWFVGLAILIGGVFLIPTPFKKFAILGGTLMFIWGLSTLPEDAPRPLNIPSSNEIVAGVLARQAAAAPCSFTLNNMRLQGSYIGLYRRGQEDAIERLRPNSGSNYTVNRNDELIVRDEETRMVLAEFICMPAENPLNIN